MGSVDSNYQLFLYLCVLRYSYLFGRKKTDALGGDPRLGPGSWIQVVAWKRRHLWLVLREKSQHLLESKEQVFEAKRLAERTM